MQFSKQDLNTYVIGVTLSFTEKEALGIDTNLKVELNEIGFAYPKNGHEWDFDCFTVLIGEPDSDILEEVKLYTIDKLPTRIKVIYNNIINERKIESKKTINKYKYLENDILIDSLLDLHSVLERETIIFDMWTRDEVKNLFRDTVEKVLYKKDSEYLGWLDLSLNEKEDYFVKKYNFSLVHYFVRKVIKEISLYVKGELEYVKKEVETPYFDKVMINKHLFERNGHDETIFNKFTTIASNFDKEDLLDIIITNFMDDEELKDLTDKLHNKNLEN